MRNLKLFTFYFLLFVTLSVVEGCSHARYINKHIDEIRARICIDSVTTVSQSFKKDSMSVKDTVIHSVIDSANAILLFECDSNYQVLLKKFQIKNGQAIKTNFVFNNGQLSVDCNAEIKRMERLLEYYKDNKEIVYKQNVIKVKIPDTRKWHQVVPWYIWSISGVLLLLTFWMGRKSKLFTL